MDLLLLCKTVDEICTVNGDLVTILLIIMGSLDLMKAVMAGKEDEIKKAQGTFVKRAIAAVIVFFIPLIVSIAMGLIEIETATSDGRNTIQVNYKTCWDRAS